MENIDFINQFINDHINGITTIFNSKAKDKYDNLSSFITDITKDLVQEYDRLSFKQLNDNEIKCNLFYYINSLYKPIKNNQPQKTYTCPGCSYLGKTSTLQGNYYLKCNQCVINLSKTQNTKEKYFYNTFSNHTSLGYRCPDCKRFMPKNNNTDSISCPYFDCLFVGSISSLKKMHHPTIEGSSEITLVTKTNQENSPIKEVIEFQLNNLLYTNFNFTVKHKVLVYQAILQLLAEYPQQITDYLLYESRTGGFQHKIFQRYISLLEASFPFVIKKNNKVIRINNLLDDNLSLFSGISTFEGIIENNIIKNNTQEYYIGGRLASYSKPYYIGKLLNIVDKNNKNCLMENVVEYTFSKIKVRDIVSNTPVIVTHLRVPPHYQMGGMVYVNRIRKKIVDQLRK